MIGYLIRSLTGRTGVQRVLRRHFTGLPPESIVTAAREYPVTSRVDIQAALDQLFAERPDTRLVGVHTPMTHETPTLSHLLAPGPFAVEIAPRQYDELDVGDPTTVRCLKNGLWLSRHGSVAFAVLLAPSMRYGQVGGVHVEIAVPAGEAGADFSQAFLSDLERRVAVGKTYRGRVLSLESYQDYLGRGGAVKVHRLPRVQRDDVILPESTLALLDRNVAGFIAARDALRELRFPGRKGLLFYGPPGTGKTYTIHYLAAQLAAHTTLLITAEQAGLIGEYFRLARFLQPAMVVIEDVDLIAREREHMHNPGQETLLNKLLNEMDGLREDADVLVVLTTNRPEHLEPALSARPGRIDQAIEFPLPDEQSRARLVKLYSRGLELPPAVADELVRRSKGASPAFIRELMRRSAQFQLELGGGHLLSQAAVDGALEEMVFAGGQLNLKLLGGSSRLAELHDSR